MNSLLTFLQEGSSPSEFILLISGFILFLFALVLITIRVLKDKSWKALLLLLPFAISMMGFSHFQKMSFIKDMVVLERLSNKAEQGEKLTAQEKEESKSIVFSAQGRVLRNEDRIILARAYINQNELSRAKQVVEQIEDTSFTEDKKKLSERIKIRNDIKNYENIKPGELSNKDAQQFKNMFNKKMMTVSDIQEASIVQERIQKMNDSVKR
ncbi:MAG: hypothetical protein V3V00_05780 [Saprospiraceae bacterium]